MRRTWLRWGRLLGGAAVLAVVVWRLGLAPFLEAAGRVDGGSLLAGAAIAVPTTVCCAWRWSLVGRGLGVRIPLRSAVAAYYRSQFLNTTLPGGVVGDVHRAVGHGRAVGDLGRAVRAVAWERCAGQGVQGVLTLAVLVVAPSPVRAAARSSLPAAGVVAVALAAVAVAVAAARAGRRGAARHPARRRAPSAGSLPARAARTVTADLRDGLFSRRAWPGVLLASAVVVAGHSTTFLIAARAAGTSVPAGRLLPLALLVLLAMAIPANVAGWGPREGVAAWSFGAAGLGAEQGVVTAVVYGVMVLAASLPGAVLLVVGWLRTGTDGRHAEPVAAPGPRAASEPQGAIGG